MQVRPVRMEQSPATRLWTAGTPHHCGALFTARRSDMGTLLSLLCLRRGVPMYYPRAARFRLHPDRFSNAGKTIYDPSMRTVHSPPELNQ